MGNGTYSGVLGNITLNSAHKSVTFTSSAVVTATSGNAVEGGSSHAYTIFSEGTIQSATGAGIYLLHGGSITNGTAGYTTALIAGGSAGINIGGARGTVTNAGTIESSGGDAIELRLGGIVANSGSAALISGASYGVYVSHGAGTITNDGTIAGTSGAGVELRSGGAVTNTGTASLIDGGKYGVLVSGGIAGTVTNYGTITGTGRDGVRLGAGGSVANSGSAALIQGGSIGVYAYGVATVTNDGTIAGTNTGIDLQSGGTVVNAGSRSLIKGAVGVYSYVYGTVVNYGTIAGTGGTSVKFGASNDVLVDEVGSAFIGTVVGGGGTLELAGGRGTIAGLGSQYTGFGAYDVLDGASWTLGGNATVSSYIGVAATGMLTLAGTLDLTGTLVGGGNGIYVADSGSLTNSGTIVGEGTNLGNFAVEFAGTGSFANSGTVIGGTGVYLLGGGYLTNSGTASLIVGRAGGIIVENAPGTVTNDGTIAGYDGYDFFGVKLLAGGAVTNTGTASLIEGGIGVGAANAAVTITNAGTIAGIVAQSSVGIFLDAGGAVVNSGTASLIEGTIGVYLAGAAAGTVTNYGTISGTRYPSVLFQSSSDVLIDEAGSTFIGTVAGGGGTLELAGTAGTLAGLGSQYTGFGQYQVLANASWTLGGSNTVASAVSIDAAGTLDLTGTLVSSGTAVYALNSAVFTNTGSVLSTGSGAVGVALATTPSGHVAAFVNAGTVSATGSASVGVELLSGGHVTNNIGGYISGSVGVLAVEGGTLTNFGTIVGTGGTAIQFEQADTLVDEAGSSIVGLVIGDGGSLDLAGGNTAHPGTISGLGSTFTGFANYALSGAWVFTGSNTIAAADNLRSTGALIDNGTVEIDGGAVFSGALSGTGTLILDGTESLHGQTIVSVADLVIGGGALTIAAGFSDAKTFDLAAGDLALSGQSVTLSGTAVVSGGTVVGSGGFDTTGTTEISGGDFGGLAIWQNRGTAIETGTVTFGNAGGDGQLTNLAGGVFDITGNFGVAVAGQGGGVVNHGLFEKTSGSGDSLIAGSMNNGGSILDTSGTLQLVGAIQGTGSETIGAAGELRFNAAVASTQTISFSGSGGELSLSETTASLSSFAAGISGFGAGDGILIGAFAYSGTPQVHWTQQGSKGTLAITDNGSTLNLILFGQYAAGTFAANNSGGATLVTYTPPQQQVVAISHH